MVWEIRYI
jgi:hypothetical protein